MIDIRTFKAVESSFEVEQVELQNQSLKKSNTILFGIIAVAILVFIGAYIRTHEDEKAR
ncbi:hypothetical protein [Flavobacterium sp.]|uniref:hypothetical protein n=1 Tax=Flavobacterium sp. TaxID=239 RepID=UPI002B4AFFCF|nr:hypothetical protein [Flavobacterium sp.]HLF52295.1 hypothetical protein [Flavobacterium sp.]